MRKFICFNTALATLSLAGQTGTFTDDFNRADVAATTNGSLIGSSYHNSIEPNHRLKNWEISGNKLVFSEPEFSQGGGAILYSIDAQTPTGDGESFNISVTTEVQTADRWSGVAFNYQDAGNFYAFRIQAGSKNYQVLKVVNGELTAIVNLSNSTSIFALDTRYRISVGYDDASGLYLFSVKDMADTRLNPNIVLRRATIEAPFENGTGGVYASGINMTATYDDLSASSVP